MLGKELEIFRGSDNLLPDLTAAREASDRSRRSGKRRSTVLVVDDQRLIADTLTDILNGNGYRATAAYSGHDALRLAEEIRPDFLLTDVVMPAMNGVELAIAIQTKFPETRIMLLSGQAGIADILQQGRARGYEFNLVAKPIHPDRLMDHLKSLG